MGEPLDDVIRRRRARAEPHGDPVDDLGRLSRFRARVGVEDDGHLDAGVRRVLAQHMDEPIASVLQPPPLEDALQLWPRVHDVVAVDDQRLHEWSVSE